ncbi:MAG: hypothetical protein BWX92_03691 [Deltaproteobacteria bacterium ADurb.Bin135]|nr:MAG: hypothetical protein BWX92_03691 [Deltaproteobacteria bacterium ADurb.Bin135]
MSRSETMNGKPRHSDSKNHHDIYEMLQMKVLLDLSYFPWDSCPSGLEPIPTHCRAYHTNPMHLGQSCQRELFSHDTVL